MKIAIISDVHANYEALAALPQTYDELWVLGDLVNYGPQPREVIEFVRRKAAVVVRGNHDHSVGFDEDPRCSTRYQKMAEETRRFSNATLTDVDKAFLRSLPLSIELERDGRRFLLCHAVPSDPLYDYRSADSERWAGELANMRADILLVGHTHKQFVRRIGNKTLVNPGSLGQPKTGKPDACYAVWNGSELELKQFSYAVEKTIEKLRALTLSPEVRADLETVLRTGSI